MSETIEKTFSVLSPARLNLSNIRGSVNIRTGVDGVIHIIAVKQEGTGDLSRTEVEITQEADGTIKAVTHYPDSGWGWLTGSHPCKVDYKVQAPRFCSLKVNGVSNRTLVEGFEGEFSLNTVSGEMTLNDLKGSLKANTVSGNLELAGISGSLDLHSVSGRISGDHLTGPLHLDTVSGKVELVGSDLPSAEATTVSGALDFQTPLNSGPYRFNTVSGNIQLVLPADTHCSAELHAVSGSITSRLPASSTSRHNSTQSIEILGGGVKVNVHSVSGSLSLIS
jgi:hypothetical protein